MSIAEQIQHDTKEAMKSRDRVRSNALRMLQAALKNSEIEAGRPLTKGEEQVVLRRQLKQREESSEAFRNAGREERAEAEAEEAGMIRAYLPAPLSPEELEKIVDQAIEETGASGMRDMGAVMGRATATAGNRAEGRKLSEIAVSRLQ